MFNINPLKVGDYFKSCIVKRLEGFFLLLLVKKKSNKPNQQLKPGTESYISALRNQNSRWTAQIFSFCRLYRHYSQNWFC